LQEGKYYFSVYDTKIVRQLFPIDFEQVPSAVPETLESRIFEEEVNDKGKFKTCTGQTCTVKGCNVNAETVTLPDGKPGCKVTSI